MSLLKDKVVIVTGSTRGIGRAIALRCAQDGATVVIVGKTAEPHPQLEGTVHSVAAEVNALGGTGIPVQCDMRDEAHFNDSIARIGQEYGQIDILVNNASALFVAPVTQTEMKRFDLMFGVNVRGTYSASQACLPFLMKAQNPQILTISPPLNMKPKWFKGMLAYTMSKYGMSMCTLGMAEEFKELGINVNSLWPKTTIATAAIKKNFPPHVLKASRKPEIMSDAAYYILTRARGEMTGQILLDEDVLALAGVIDLSHYAQDPSLPLVPDLYID